MRKLWTVVACMLFVCFSVMPVAVPDVVDQSVWATQQVNSSGVGTNPFTGSGDDQIRIQGIALNNSSDYLDPNLMFQVYVQGEGPNQGGIAAWAGCFYQGGPGSPQWQSEYTRLSTGWQAGDRIQITGWLTNHNGKSNINERHNSSSDMDFSITLLEAGVGLPAPTVIPSISACNTFDAAGDPDPLLAHRHTGGELYQAQRCMLRDVWLVSGTWAAGQTVVVTDDGINELPLLLSSEGTFGTGPTGQFHVSGIFDQEDPTDPYTGDYRLWVGDQTAVTPEPGTCILLLVTGLAGLCARWRQKRGL